MGRGRSTLEAESQQKGGRVIIDDYALVGCRKAVDEFFTGKEYPDVVLDGRGGGWFKKVNK